MGRWPSKKRREERAMRIVKLRDVDGVVFADIARRMGVKQGVIEYSYHHFKEKEHG